MRKSGRFPAVVQMLSFNILCAWLSVSFAIMGCGSSDLRIPSPFLPSEPSVVGTIIGPNPHIGIGLLPVLSNGTLGSAVSIPVAGLTSSGPLQGIALDTQGEMFVGELPPSGASSSPLGAVLVFAPKAVPTSTPVRIIKGSNTALFLPTSLAVDPVGNLYVSSPGQDIIVFAPGADGNATPVRRLTAPFSKNTGITAVNSMCVDSSGNLYITNELDHGALNILVFGPTQSGDVAPMRTISGTATLLGGNTFGGVFDASGNLYVTTESVTPVYGGILEFAAGASGNVAPIRVISGSNTSLGGAHVTNPVLDSAGNLYVMSVLPGSSPNILKFAADANGNASPTAVLPSGTTIDSFSIAWH